MGRAIVAGGKPAMEGPTAGILASDIAVGSSVYLMENGSAVEYLVVNNGIPSDSSLYDSSCDGLWLLRKNIYTNRAWHSSQFSNYEASDIHSYLNSTFFNLLDETARATVKQVKIPYVYRTSSSSTVRTGANGLSAKVFLLSGNEVGGTSYGYDYMPDGEGALLAYFSDGATGNSKRIAYYNGTATKWFLRSPYMNQYSWIWEIGTNGGISGRTASCITEDGIRPALILSGNALFDTDTLVLKGVA